MPINSLRLKELFDAALILIMRLEIREITIKSNARWCKLVSELIKASLRIVKRTLLTLDLSKWWAEDLSWVVQQYKRIRDTILISCSHP